MGTCPGSTVRGDGRQADQLRTVSIETGIMRYAEGSALIQAGATRVLCSATVEEKVPPFLNGQQRGWVTAEYGMLPRATSTRNPREAARGKLSGRTMEIQRLIGRSLRAVVDSERLGPRTVLLDCDVLQADGGTRTASITAAWVALALAVEQLCRRGLVAAWPLRDNVAAISIGIRGSQLLLDLNYEEDSQADVDMNMVMTGQGRLVEIQGTAEHRPFSEEQLQEMIDLGKQGLQHLFRLQNEVLEKAGVRAPMK